MWNMLKSGTQFYIKLCEVYLLMVIIILGSVVRIYLRQEMQIQSLGWEDPLKEMATHSSIFAWRIPWTVDPVCYSSWGRKKSDMT